MINWQYKVAAVATLAASLAAWWHFRPQPAPVSVPVIATPSKAVSSVGVETIRTPVKVYKPEAKKRLNLPQNITQDASKHVAASSTIKPDDHPHTVSTVIDDKTGEVTTYDTRGPLPWLAVDNHGEAGVAYGIRDGQPTVRLEVRQNLLDVKAVKLGVEATVDQPMSGPLGSSYFVGVGLAYRW